MSGVVGIVGAQATVAEMRRHLRGLDARGPSARWELAGEGFAVGAVASGKPLGGARVGEANGWVVALDGEAPNAGSLAREFGLSEADGAAITVATLLGDTGVARILPRLGGDVGFVAFERNTGRLVVARGALGARPLFVRVGTAGVVVSTSPLSLRRDSPAALATEAEGQWISLGCVVPPTEWNVGVRALSAGTWVEFGTGGVQEFRWFQHDRPERLGRGNRERFVRSAHYALDGAVRASVAAAGPWAIALSGGAASAAILACRPSDNPPSLAIFVGDSGSSAPGALAEVAGIPTKSVRLDVDDVEGLLDEVSLDQPVVSPESLLWLLLARTAWAEGLAGLALGVGAGAAFHPPPVERSWIPKLRGRVLAEPTAEFALRAALRHQAYPGDERAPGWDAFVALAAAAPSDAGADRYTWLYDYLWAPERDLRAVDQACATWGLSAVLPYANPAVLRVARQIPAEVHHATGERSVLREVVHAAGGSDQPILRENPALSIAALWLLRTNAIKTSADALAAQISPAHVLDLESRVQSREPAAVRRAWSLAMLVRWRAAIATAG